MTGGRGETSQRRDKVQLNRATKKGLTGFKKHVVCAQPASNLFLQVKLTVLERISCRQPLGYISGKFPDQTEEPIPTGVVVALQRGDVVGCSLTALVLECKQWNKMLADYIAGEEWQQVRSLHTGAESVQRTSRRICRICTPFKLRTQTSDSGMYAGNLRAPGEH